MKVKHLLDYCETCKCNVILCGGCLNNCCSGVYGEINGQVCKDCPDAYKSQESLSKFNLKEKSEELYILSSFNALSSFGPTNAYVDVIRVAGPFYKYQSRETIKNILTKVYKSDFNITIRFEFIGDLNSLKLDDEACKLLNWDKNTDLNKVVDCFDFESMVVPSSFMDDESLCDELSEYIAKELIKAWEPNINNFNNCNIDYISRSEFDWFVEKFKE